MAKQSVHSQVQLLDGHYIFREPTKVIGFLEQHPFLISLLSEARSEIRAKFPLANVFLELVPDQEIKDGDELVAFVATHLPPPEAVQRLKQFYSDWWIGHAKRAEGKLSINLEIL